MEKIIDKIFHLQVQEEPTSFSIQDNTAFKQEWQLYDYLYTHLKGDDQTAFTKYANYSSDRHAEELKIAYKNGFQTAIKLILEAARE